MIKNINKKRKQGDGYIMSTYVTGDIHGSLRRILKLNDNNLNREDYLIVLGDMGICWDDNHAGLNNALKI